MDGQGDSLTITTEQVQAMQNFLDNLSTADSSGLQQVMADELSRISPLDDFVGMTMEGRSPPRVHWLCGVYTRHPEAVL